MTSFVHFIVAFAVFCSSINGDNIIGIQTLFSSELSELVNVSLSINGYLPNHIFGTLVKNGVGRYEVGEQKFQHIFDGFAKLHSFYIQPRDKKIIFSSRFLKTNSYTWSTTNKEIHPNLYFDDVSPQFSILQKACALMNGPDNTNVNIYNLSGTVMALSDYWPAYEFNIQNLETKRRVETDLPWLSAVESKLPLLSTAHPLHEKGSGKTITLLSVHSPTSLISSSIHLIRRKSLQLQEVIASIYVPKASYMHSFALSAHYAILFADPLYVSFPKIVSATLTKSMQWKPEEGTSVHVIHLKSGNRKLFKIAASFHLHHVNSFEKDDSIYIDYVRYPDFAFMSELKISQITDSDIRKSIKITANLVRYRINLKDETVKEVIPSNPNTTSLQIDFPTFNDNYRFKHYCFTYGIAPNAQRDDFLKTAIYKHDWCHGKHKRWYRTNHFPSETIFVPACDKTWNNNCEDDGSLISIVLDGTVGKSYLLILDAHTFKTIATAYAPVHIPYPLHGNFFPGSTLNRPSYTIMSKGSLNTAQSLTLYINFVVVMVFGMLYA